MRILFFLLTNFLLAVAFHSFALADQPSFSVEIVGSRQLPGAAGDQGNGPDYPSIEIPRMSAPENIANIDPTEAVQGRGEHSFFVIVRNISTKPIKLWLAMSSLFDSLNFDITRPNGSIIHFNRFPRPWHANSMEAWYFPPNGMRVFCIDFTTTSWEQKPKTLEVGSLGLCKMRATFICLAAYPSVGSLGNDGKTSHTFQSPETEVVATVLK